MQVCIIYSPNVTGKQFHDAILSITYIKRAETKERQVDKKRPSRIISNKASKNIIRAKKKVKKSKGPVYVGVWGKRGWDSTDIQRDSEMME